METLIFAVVDEEALRFLNLARSKQPFDYQGRKAIVSEFEGTFHTWTSHAFVMVTFLNSRNVNFMQIFETGGTT